MKSTFIRFDWDWPALQASFCLDNGTNEKFVQGQTRYFRILCLSTPISQSRPDMTLLPFLPACVLVKFGPAVWILLLKGQMWAEEKEALQPGGNPTVGSHCQARPVPTASHGSVSTLRPNSKVVVTWGYCPDCIKPPPDQSYQHNPKKPNI